MSSATRIDLAVCARIASTCAFYRLRRASRVVSRRIELAFEDEVLTPNQLLLLIGLSLTGGAKVQNLADLLGLDHSTLSRTLAPLLARGWIQHADGSDRRASPVELTNLGRQHVVRAAAAWEQFQSGMEKSLGAKRWARLSKDLDAVIALGEPTAAKNSKRKRR
jgi:DNA-binding MarR family transcriptional regulator